MDERNPKLFESLFCDTNINFVRQACMGSPDRPPKQEAFLALLAEGWTSLHLDARREGVVVPAHLKGEPHLVLQYGHDLPIPIPDLHVDEYGVSATLSFEWTPRSTVVPWSAVYVVTAADGRGVLYQEDIPSDVSVIAASGSDSSPGLDGAPTGPGAIEADAGPDGEAGTSGSSDNPGYPGNRGKPRSREVTAGDAASAGPAPRGPTPSRALRAVPLTGPLEEDHPAMASVSFGGVTVGRSGGGAAAGAGAEMMGDSAPSTMVPSRRRRRPQLRLVK
jgi:hypothetical protein